MLHEVAGNQNFCEEQLTFIGAKMKENDKLTSEELGKMLASQFGVASAERQVRHEKIWLEIYENTRYCQFVHELNKIKKIVFFWLNALSRKYLIKCSIYN